MASFFAERKPVTTLPGEPVPYVIKAGRGRAHVLLGEVARALAGAEESGGAMSVMRLDGPKSERPIPLHFHEAEHEFFYCFRGAIQPWADGESRILRPGDFGYVPPGTVHSFQLRGNHSSFVGPVVPGGWDRFFDLTGEPWDYAAFPQGPKGPPPFETFARAEVEFKMKFRPDLEYAPARDDAAADALPGGQEGRLRVTLDGDEHLMTRGDTASIPAGAEHSYTSDGHYAKVLTMSAPGGPEQPLAAAGKPTDERVFSDEPEELDLDALRGAAAEVDVYLA